MIKIKTGYRCYYKCQYNQLIPSQFICEILRKWPVSVVMETFECKIAKLFIFQYIVKMQVTDHISKNLLFEDAAVRFLLGYFVNFIRL